MVADIFSTLTMENIKQAIVLIKRNLLYMLNVANKNLKLCVWEKNNKKLKIEHC